MKNVEVKRVIDNNRPIGSHYSVYREGDFIDLFSFDPDDAGEDEVALARAMALAKKLEQGIPPVEITIIYQTEQP